MAVLLAGRDTTAGTLSWAFCTFTSFPFNPQVTPATTYDLFLLWITAYSLVFCHKDELAAYPDKWARLREEVLLNVGLHKAPTYDDLKNLRYLRYTLNETLRLYPAVPYNVRTALQVSTP